MRHYILGLKAKYSMAASCSSIDLLSGEALLSPIHDLDLVQGERGDGVGFIISSPPMHQARRSSWGSLCRSGTSESTSNEDFATSSKLSLANVSGSMVASHLP